MLTVVALLAPVASVEAGVGLVVCGAREAATCEGAETGVVVDLRGHWHPRPWLGVGLATLYASLPAEGVATGNLLYVGPEVALRGAPTPAVGLTAAVTAGFDRVAGTGGRVTGLGALGLRLGARYRVARPVELGLDYGLLQPQLDAVCTGLTCAGVDVGLLHRFSVVVGVPFW